MIRTDFFACLRLCLLSLALVIFAIPSAYALEALRITETDKAIDLTNSVIISRDQGPSFQVSTLAGSDGIVRRIEMRSITENPSGHWAVFALANDSERQIDRLITIPHFRLVNSGIIWPDLGSTRIINITPSEGFALENISDDTTDIFEVTLNPGSVVTFVAELATPNLPKVELWNPESYKDRQNAFTLFKGIVLGISGLLAMFLTIVFVVRGTSLFPATAALAWAVLAYISIDFGFLNSAIAIGPGSEQIWRAGTEVALAAILLLFLFAYLRLNRWHSNFSYLMVAWIIALIALSAVAITNPPIAAGIARISFAATVAAGVFLIAYLGMQGFDRAIMLIPAWLLLIAWMIAASMTVQGDVDNDIVQPALGGGLVMIIVLLGFTVMQHAFAGGSGIHQGLFSDVERKALALTGAGDIVWDWDVSRDRVSLTPDISLSLGFEKGALIAPPRDWVEHLHVDDRERFKTTLDIIVDHKRGRIDEDFRIQNQNGRFTWYTLKARPVVGHDGEVVRCIGTLVDSTERKLAEERLLRDAVTDNLTGLPNRDIMVGQINAALTLARNDKNLRPTLMVIDIDRFRLVNEAYGASAGDTLLIAISKRLTRILGPADMLCRLHGDSFALLLLSQQEPAAIAALSEEFLKQISLPINHTKNEIVLTASIGLTTPSNGVGNAIELLKDAELAMYQAKRFGGNRIEPFRPAFRATGSDRLQIEADLRRALEREEIRNVYQPIVDLKSGRIAGFESLMRWEHPRRGAINPSAFIPIAEETGLIVQLGAYAMQTAATDLKRWREETGNHKLFVSVNVSSLQLMRQDLFGTVQSVIQRTNIEPSGFKLELTESLLMEDPERATMVLKKLRDLGVGLSIDDFGTGHSSLSYLSQFPFDTLKIDRSFLIDKSVRRVPMLKALVSLGRDLGMTVVAEGVEGHEDARMLREFGCTYVQSFAFGEPREADQVVRLIKIKPKAA